MACADEQRHPSRQGLGIHLFFTWLVSLFPSILVHQLACCLFSLVHPTYTLLLILVAIPTRERTNYDISLGLAGKRPYHN